MLTALIKKQFAEAGRSFFVDPKTGKGRSKGATIGVIALYVVLIAGISFAFASLAELLAGFLFAAKLEWLYFAVMGFIALILGAYGSIFSTYSMLYLSKDNDLLLSMPIPPSRILTSRMVLVFALGFLYSACVWIPAMVVYFIHVGMTGSTLICGILLQLSIVFFVTVLTCLLGWVVALIASRIKNKNSVKALLGILAIGLYFALRQLAPAILEAFKANLAGVESSVKSWGQLLVMLGKGATGNIGDTLIFMVITLVLLGICIAILSKSFYKIVTYRPGRTKNKAGKEKIVTHSARATLLNREWKRFSGSATYMLNTGMGVIFAIVIAVFLLVKGDLLLGMVDQIRIKSPDTYGFVPVVVLFLVEFCLGMDAIGVPSISLEGKYLWIIRSLPVSAREVLGAKIHLHFLINGIGAFISIVLFGIIMKLEVVNVILMLILSLILVWLQAMIAVMLGLRHPNFLWTSETVPIKHDYTILLFMVISWVLSLIACGGYFLLHTIMNVQIYMIIVIVFFGLISLLYYKRVNTKGAAKFDRL